VIGSNHLSFVCNELAIRVTTDAPVAYLTEEVLFPLQAPIHLILGPDETTTEAIDVVVREYFDQTEAYWVEWCRFLSVPFE
jgi:hypothetical protein